MRIIAKIASTLLGCLVLFGLAGTANAGTYEDGAKLYASTSYWAPLNYNDTWLALVDPFGIYKVDNDNYDVNIAFINNQNLHVPEQTFTYRIDCKNTKFQIQGWRVNGILKNYKGPLGIWIRNPTRDLIPSQSIISTAKDHVCGKEFYGSTYYYNFSSFQNDQLRGVIDVHRIKNNTVTISQTDTNFRVLDVMLSPLDQSASNLSQLFVRCDRRELMQAANGIVTIDWWPINPASGEEVTFQKMCSNRFNYINFQTAPVTLPTPKPAVAPSTDVNLQLQGDSSIDEAKKKCADLGFKLGTEKFGNCVLKVSR